MFAPIAPAEDEDAGPDWEHEFPHIEEQSQTSTAGKWMPRAPKKEGQATAKQCKKKKLHIAVVSESPGGLSFSERADLRREVSRAERVSDEEERSTPQKLCHEPSHTAWTAWLCWVGAWAWFTAYQAINRCRGR